MDDAVRSITIRNLDPEVYLELRRAAFEREISVAAEAKRALLRIYGGAPKPKSNPLPPEPEPKPIERPLGFAEDGERFCKHGRIVSLCTLCR